MDQFSKVTNLVKNGNNETYPTFTYSILEKIVSGKIYMDKFDKSALIGTNPGIFVVTGEKSNKDFHSLLVDIYEDRKKENKRFTLFSPSKEWDEIINNLFEKKLRPLKRYSFQFNKSKFLTLKTEEFSCEYKLQRIDKKVISESTGFNETYLNEYWGSVSNFINNGFGYCMIHDDTIASECISIFSSKQFAEIDITTHSSFRGLGLAQNVARAFIEHCIEEEVIPNWDCDVNNLASIKLAKRLGFENPTEYTVYVRT